MRDDLVPGGKFPDLELDDHTGARRHMSELTAEHATLVHFYRGWWCPKEQRFLRNLVGLQDEVEVAYSRLVSVTVDPPWVTAPFRAGLGARWTFLSDPDRRVQQDLDLEETADTVHRPFLPYSFVVAPNLEIASVFNGYWYWGRPTLEEIRQALREVTRRIQPTWDPQQESR